MLETRKEKTVNLSSYGRMCRYTVATPDDYDALHAWMVANDGDRHWNRPSSPSHPPLISDSDDRDAYAYDQVDYVIETPEAGCVEWDAPVPANMSVVFTGHTNVNLHTGHIVATDNVCVHIRPESSHGNIRVDAHDNVMVYASHDDPSQDIRIHAHDDSTWNVAGRGVDVYAGDDTHGHLVDSTAHLDGNAEVVAHGGTVYATDTASVWNDGGHTKIHRTEHGAPGRIRWERRRIYY